MFRIVLKLAEFRRIEFRAKTKDARSPPRFKRRRDIDRYRDNYCYNIALYISMDVCTNRSDAKLLWNRANRTLYLKKANRIVIRSVTTCARTYVTPSPSIVYRKQVCTHDNIVYCSGMQSFTRFDVKSLRLCAFRHTICVRWCTRIASHQSLEWPSPIQNRIPPNRLPKAIILFLHELSLIIQYKSIYRYNR